MSEILIKDKEIVVPGENLAKGMDCLPGNGTYRDKEFIVASKLGMVNVDGRALKIIPLSGKYSPKRDDIIIGQVCDIVFSGWRVETNSAYQAMLNVRDATSEYIEKTADLTKYFNFGDYIVAKITNVTSQKLIDLTMKAPGLHKLSGGRIIKINTNKVPRVIGKQGSMVSMVKNATGCRITVGQNGLVWIDGEPENEIIAVDAVKMIEKESHISGLTERIKSFLEKSTGKKVIVGEVR
ncbi:MAG: RNA-binding protein [Nanoarchaeota archaeon]|nr:RNA-binding protein [Nanoarchaeota archaeon]